MKRYIKSPSADVVILPGIGKLTEGKEVTGDYDQYVPQFLVEVPSAHGSRTLESTPSHNPRPLTEPAPVRGAPSTDSMATKGGPGATVSENVGTPAAPPHPAKEEDKKSDDDKGKHKKPSSKGNE